GRRGAAAPVPGGGGPHLEVEVAGGGGAGVADEADWLAGPHDFAGQERRGFGQVRVQEVDRLGAAVHHDVVAGQRLVAGVLDDAAAGGDQRRAAGGHRVLALVGVAG